MKVLVHFLADNGVRMCGDGSPTFVGSNAYDVNSQIHLSTSQEEWVTCRKCMIDSMRQMVSEIKEMSR